jgi:hypothetical protein
MIEVLEAAFSGVNVVYTALLLLVLIYWVIVILGVIDLDAINFDVEADVDVDGLEGPLEGSGGGLSWLAFFNVGEVPIMFFVSIVVLTMWVISMQANVWLASFTTSWVAEYRGWIAAAMAIPNLIFALFMAKFLLIPVKRMRQREPQRTNLVGKTCLVTSLEVSETFGRCEMPKVDSSLILDVRTQGGEVLHKGDAAEIIEQIRENEHDVYVVTRKVWDS